jgi:hypothetical protein
MQQYRTAFICKQCPVSTQRTEAEITVNFPLKTALQPACKGAYYNYAAVCVRMLCVYLGCAPQAAVLSGWPLNCENKHSAQSLKPSRNSSLLASTLICVAMIVTHSTMKLTVNSIGSLMRDSSCVSLWLSFSSDLRVQ